MQSPELKRRRTKVERLNKNFNDRVNNIISTNSDDFDKSNELKDQVMEEERK